MLNSDNFLLQFLLVTSILVLFLSMDVNFFSTIKTQQKLFKVAYLDLILTRIINSVCECLTSSTPSLHCLSPPLSLNYLMHIELLTSYYSPSLPSLTMFPSILFPFLPFPRLLPFVSGVSSIFFEGPTLSVLYCIHLYCSSLAVDMR